MKDLAGRLGARKPWSANVPKDVPSLIFFGDQVESFRNLLVGGDWNMTFIFPETVGNVIPTDELMFIRGVGSSTNQLTINTWS